LNSAFRAQGIAPFMRYISLQWPSNTTNYFGLTIPAQCRAVIILNCSTELLWVLNKIESETILKLWKSRELISLANYTLLNV